MGELKQISELEISDSSVSLCQALMSAKNVEDCYRYLCDLCTPAERKSLEERWLVAQMLYNTDKSYRQIHEDTGVSIATITRVARFLFHENYAGYKIIIDTINARREKDSSVAQG